MTQNSKVRNANDLWTLTDDFQSANWTNVPFYVVGESTASALQDHSPSHLASLYPSACLGANSGTGEQLANFILSNGSTTKRCKTKLLFLVGDKNRDILPKALEAGGYELDTLQVYETCGSPLFASSLGSVVSSSPSSECFIRVTFVGKLKFYPSERVVGRILCAIIFRIRHYPPSQPLQLYERGR